MQSNNLDWMKSLKPGDEVFFEVNTFGNAWMKPGVVDRITKTMVILKSGTRFHFDGNEVGSCYSGKIVQSTEATRERYWVQEHLKEMAAVIESIYGFRSFRRSTLTKEQIERMLPALTAIRDELKGA